MDLRIMATASAMALGMGAPALADPACASPDNWPASMTFARLKNDGVLSNDQVDFTRTEVVLLASQKIKPDLYRQVFRVTYRLKTGRAVRAITVSDASREECSMSDVTVYRLAEEAR